MNNLARACFLAAGIWLADLSRAQQVTPTFGQYPVSEKFNGPRAPLRLRHRQDREFRTELTMASKRPVNYAGHYIVANIGCGASCLLTAVVNAQSGAIVWLPFSLCCWDPNGVQPVLHRVDSDLLVLHGQRDESGIAGTYFMRLVQGRFQEVYKREPALETPLQSAPGQPQR